MKYIILLVSVLFVFASCNLNRSKEFEYAYTAENMLDEGDNYKLEIKYPVFNNTYVDSVIQSELEFLTRQFKSQIGTQRVSENWKNEQNVNIETFYSSRGYLSLLFYNYLFTGGAHGNTMLKSIVLDPVAEEEIKLSAVMQGAFFDKLKSLTRKQLKDKLGYDEWINEGTETLADFTIFILPNDSIRFYFPQYQVASYAAGIQKVSFPLAEFQKSSTKQ